MGNRYTYTEEFRREAVELARSSDRPRYLNRYTYVRNNPLKYTDPTGRTLSGLAGGYGESIEDLAGVAALQAARAKDTIDFGVAAGSLAASLGLTALETATD